jgi:hypothetical protein
VQYFVKLELRKDQPARHAASRLGVSFQSPIRLAICKSWRVEDRGFKVSREFKESQKFKALAESLHAAGLTQGQNRKERLSAAQQVLTDTEESCRIWRALKGSSICLKGSRGSLDGIDLLAVPISSTHEGTPWGVDAVVHLDPAKAKVVLNNTARSPAGMQAAITRLQKTSSFFTPSHATSQQGSWVA